MLHPVSREGGGSASPACRFIRSNHLWEISFRPLTNESSADYQKAIDTLTKVVEAQEAAEAAAYTDAAVKGASALQVETAVAKKIDADTAGGWSPPALELHKTAQPAYISALELKLPLANVDSVALQWALLKVCTGRSRMRYG